jgi:chromosome segregation ATPase
MSEQILNLILSEVREVKSKVDSLEKDVKDLKEGQNFLKKDIKDLSIMTGEFATRFDTIDSEITGVSKKLDRQIASSRSNSAKFRELEMRIEDLEGITPQEV